MESVREEAEYMANNQAPSEAGKPLAVSPLSSVAPRQRSSSLKSDPMDGKEFGLPEGWTVEQRTRTNEKYIGKVDQIYYEPGTGKTFRSLKAVERHLNIKLKREHQKTQNRTDNIADEGESTIDGEMSTADSNKDGEVKEGASNVMKAESFPTARLKNVKFLVTNGPWKLQHSKSAKNMAK